MTFLLAYWSLWLLGTIVCLAGGIFFVIKAINVMGGDSEGNLVVRLGIAVFFLASSLVFGALLLMAGIADGLRLLQS